MPTPDAILAAGVIFARGDGNTPEVFTAVAGLFNYESEIETEEVNVTNHGSTGLFGEYLPGLHSGELTTEIYLLPHTTPHHAMRMDQLNRVTRNYRVYYPTAVLLEDRAYDDYSLFIKGFKQTWEGNGEEAAEAEITLRVTGLPTFSTS